MKLGGFLDFMKFIYPKYFIYVKNKKKNFNYF